LNDQRLYEKLDRLADESRDKGDLQGILLTGLRQNGCELIQKYLDQTNDIRTAALLAIYVSEDIIQECPYVQEWIHGFVYSRSFVFFEMEIFYFRYRFLLDELQLWNERAEFDIYRSHVNGVNSHRRQIFDRTVNGTPNVSCMFCQTPLELNSNSFAQTPTNLNSSSSIQTTPMRPNLRQSQQITSRSSASSSSNYHSQTPFSDMVSIFFFFFFFF